MVVSVSFFILLGWFLLLVGVVQCYSLMIGYPLHLPTGFWLLVTRKLPKHFQVSSLRV